MTVVSKLYGGVILTLSPVYNYRDRSVTSVFLNSVKTFTWKILSIHHTFNNR